MRGLRNHKVEEEVVDDEQELTLGKRLADIRDKLKLGPHYKMERFTVLFITSLSFLLLFTGLSFASYRSDVVNIATTQAVYTEDFTFSLSEQKMTVEGVYGNEDKTDVMVLLRMASPDGMSADANNYELFITGERKSLSHTPDTTFSIFGATGYAIVRFQSNEPIPQEVMAVTIRANSELTAQKDPTTVTDEVDESFAEYDQGKFYVNPGADNVTVLENFKTGETDPSKLYISLVAEEKDKAIRDEIEKQTKELGQLLNRADEYRNRLVSTGYIPPKTPWFVEGDLIDKDGVFRPAKYMARAHIFDYYTRDIHDGYVKQIMRDLSEFSDYMVSHDSNVSGTADELLPEKVKFVEQLEREDGTVLDLTTLSPDISPSSLLAAKSAVESLQRTWDSYGSLKGKLQRNTMRDLLILDADVLSQSTGFSENRNEKAVQFY